MDRSSGSVRDSPVAPTLDSAFIVSRLNKAAH